MSHDAQVSNLRMLALVWYVWGALSAIASCGVGLVALLGGALSRLDPFDPQLQEGATIVETLFGFTGVLLLAWSALNVYTGLALAQQRSRAVIIVTSLLNLANLPVGTLLGIATLAMIARPEVQREFNRSPGRRAFTSM